MKRTIALLLAVAAVPALATAATATEERVATFKFHAEAGAFPVDGRQGYWSTPENDVRVWEDEDHVLKFDEDTLSNTEHIGVQLAAPGNVPLQVGTYTDVRWRATASNPGLAVISRSFVCSPVYGSFTINSIERDPVTGRLTDVDVEVEQRCGAPDAPAFTAHTTLSS